jgi:hypothetical protein
MKMCFSSLERWIFFQKHDFDNVQHKIRVYILSPTIMDGCPDKPLRRCHIPTIGTANNVMNFIIVAKNKRELHNLHTMKRFFAKSWIFFVNLQIFFTKMLFLRQNCVFRDLNREIRGSRCKNNDLKNVPHVQRHLGATQHKHSDWFWWQQKSRLLSTTISQFAIQMQYCTQQFQSLMWWTIRKARMSLQKFWHKPPPQI